MPIALDVTPHVAPPHLLVAPVTTPWKTIVVDPGDTLWHLAITHRTTVGAIVTKNRLPAGGHLIHVGQKLLVPGAAPSTPSSAKPAAPTPASTPTSTPTSSATSSAGRGRVHVVASGDTMTGIAKRYRISLTTLLAANRLGNPGLIHIGQRITVPSATARSSKPRPSKPTPKLGTSKGATPSTTSSGSGHSYPDATKATVAQSKARLAATPVPNRTQTASMIRATALRHGVDPRLALAIGWQESTWNQRAVSYVNAIGTMQVMPTSGIWASQLAGRTLNLYDTSDNITAGVLIIRALQNSAASREQAIAAYYQGLYSVRTRGLYADTRVYVASILRHYARM